MLKKITISNFRSISNLKIDLSKDNYKIICGANNVGKTNILRGINLFFSLDLSNFNAIEDIPKDTYITLKAIDNGTGVNHTYYRIWKWNDSEEKWNLIFNWKEYYGGEIHLYELEGYGKYEIEFYSVDKKGNVEEMEWNDVYVYE